jgi:drug/metabolite transporter (DMT)-like permease
MIAGCILRAFNASKGQTHDKGLLLQMWIKKATPFFSLPLEAPQSALTGPLLMFASAFLFAVLDCLIKSLGPQYRVWDIAFYRFGCGMILMLTVFGLRGNPFEGHNSKLLILRGVAGSMAFVAEVLSIQLIPVSTALVLFYAFPAFAALFSALLFKERVGKDIFWVLMALCGVAVFFNLGLKGGLLGQILALLGAAFAGLAVVTIRKLRETNGAVTIYLYFCLTGAAITLIPFASRPHLPESAEEWIIVGSIVGISTVAQLLMTQGFRYCKSWEGGLYLTSEVVFVSLWGILVLHEMATWHFWIGGAMILGSIIAINCRSARKDLSCGICTISEKPRPAVSHQA